MIERSSSPSSRELRTQSAADSRSPVCQSSKIDKSILNVAFRTLAAPSSSSFDSGSEPKEGVLEARPGGDVLPREGDVRVGGVLGPRPCGPFGASREGPGPLVGPLLGPLLGPLVGPVRDGVERGGGDACAVRLLLNGSGSSSSSSQSSSSSSSS